MNILLGVLQSLPPDQVAPSVGRVVEALVRAVPGQIWSGQGQVLECLGEIVARCPARLHVDAPVEAVCLLLTGDGVGGGGDFLSSRGYEVVVTLEEAAIRRNAAGAGAAASGEGSADAMDIAEFDRAYHVVSISTAGGLALAASRWALSARGLVALLLREARRGDKDYRLSAVHALSLLPWKMLAKAAPDAFLGILHVLLASIGVVPYAVAESAPAPRGDSTQDPAPPAAALNAARKPTTYKQPSSSLSLFGVRYGAAAPAAPVVATLPRVRALQASSPSSPDAAHTPAEAAGGAAGAAWLGLGLGRAPGAVSPDSSSPLSLAEVDAGGPVETAKAMATPPQPEPGALEVGDGGVGEDMVKGGGEGEGEGGGEGEGEALSPEDGERSVGDGGAWEASHVLRSADPAFKVKLYEVLTAGLSGLEEGPPADVSRNIVAWIPKLMSSAEVWSIRASSLRLLEAVMAGWAGPDDEAGAFAGRVLDCVEAGAADSKTKIKLSALCCLRSVLLPPWASKCRALPGLAERCGKILKTAALGQSSPEVLASISEITKLSASV